MKDFRYAGMHFPTNWTPTNTFWSLLDGRPTIAPDGEARWHYLRAVTEHPAALVIWRGMPKLGRRPNECTAQQYADALLGILRDAINEGKIQSLNVIRNYTFGNEPELDYEFGGAFRGFGWMASYYTDVIERLREAGIDESRLWFPAWTPGKGDLEHLDDWAHVARRCRGILVHAYGEPYAIVERVQQYLDLFRGQDILLGETHCARWTDDREGASDPWRNLALLAALRELATRESRFVGACRYTWKWGQPADGWTDAYDVEGHPELEAQYLDPEKALAEGGYQIPVTQPSNNEAPPEEPTMPEPLRGGALHPVIFACADEVTDATVPQWTMRTALLALAEAESGRRSDAIRRGRWPDVSSGWGQVIVAATPEYAAAGYRWVNGKAQKPSDAFIATTLAAYLDPWHMGRFAAPRLKGYLVKTGGDILAALRFYNKPATGQVAPAVDANYQRGLEFALSLMAHDAPPHQEEVTMPPTPPVYAVGSGLLGLMADDETEPALPSTFLPLGQSPAIVEEGMGLNGTVYRWHLPTGKSWRFHPDPKAA